MKRSSIFTFILVLSFISCSKKIVDTVEVVEMKVDRTILEELFDEDGILSERIQGDSLLFSEYFKLTFKQPIDHSDHSKGHFNQKVYLSHKDFSAPMVMYINGYSSFNNNFITEATNLLSANQIHVEHRYFNESIPNDMDPATMFNAGNELRNYLSIEQAAADLHAIVNSLKKVYTKKWLSTGISKGGQATIFHKRFYPQDVDVSIPYVAPINLEREDPRIYEHLETVGSEECRNAVFEYQKDILEEREEAFKYFHEISEKKKNAYIKNEEQAFELSVLEFSFAFWQWDGDCSHIPADTASIQRKVEYLFEIDAPGFFTSSITPINSFFYQGYTQIGMYGYDIDPFGELILTYEEDVDNMDTFLEGIEMPEYDSEAIPDVVNWLDENGNNMIYIVGGLDPWGATAITPSKNTNSFRLTKEGGNHSTRINSFSPQEQNQVRDSLRVWMNVPVMIYK